METNDFLVFNEVTCRLHACRTVKELQATLLGQLRLLIPYAYASLIPIHQEAETGELSHGRPISLPAAFGETEAKWTAQTDRWYTLWLSHSPESVVLRERDILAEGRFSLPPYESVFRDYAIRDCMQVNVVREGKPLARLALYRTRGEPLFSDQDAFYLRVLAKHIGLAYGMCEALEGVSPPPAMTARELAQTYGLTRREEELAGLLATDLKSDAIAQTMGITRNTLHNHLRNLYRKCGVSSRGELVGLR